MLADLAELPALLFLDVDDVLNVDVSGWPDKDMRGMVSVGDRQIPFRWSPQCIETLVDLHNLGLIEIRWCSSWCPYVDKLHALFATQRFEACWTDTDPLPSVRTRKLNAVRAALAEDRRVIWIDDDAIPLAKQRKKLGMRSRDALYIIPHKATGLTPALFQQIVEFAFAPYRTADGDVAETDG